MADKESFSALEVTLHDGDFRGDYSAISLPELAGSAIVDALKRGQTHYVPVPGISPLREAVVGFLPNIGIDATTDQIIITGGVQEAIFLALQGITPLDTAAILAARGDRQARFLAVYNIVYDRIRIAIPAVADPGVKSALSVRNRQVMTMPVDEAAGWLPGMQAIKQALASGRNLLYLESPSRLTGFTYSTEQVQQIAALLERHDALCIWDQTTALAVPAGYVSLATVAPERTFAIGSLWPGIGLASLQIGYVVAPAILAEALIALKQVVSICTGTPAQWAAMGAASIFIEKHAALVAGMVVIRRKVLDAFTGDDRVLNGQAINILALNLGVDTADQAQTHLARQSIKIANGIAFGAPGLLRVTMKPGENTVRLIHALLEGVSV